ncbi:tryptophan 7-halogenase [Acinetobacter sp. ANC 3926]|uniref:Tryptophan halogenase n=1 Tax=Acinetobacter genomosp. 15BJ TaxID=106651 RepID=R9ATW4_9GAMM|nr:tryptophan 7-halogenase [Acinetobacter genomosp. 15BJ]EOR05628.1 hypothetical protein F896_03054 [Acinetobacter genomosp. 15BJ]MCH7290897.1 tryptophan 7-halogenase [Acinetobacter genomosp. 15BJ]
MLNLRGIQRVCIVGGGTTGWFSALRLRQIFNQSVEVVVISAPEIPIVGVGEGGVVNLLDILAKLEINIKDFIDNTGSTLKLGFRYEQWNTGKKEDYYYHLFPNIDTPEMWDENGYYPFLSLLLNNGLNINSYMEALELCENKVPFNKVIDLLISGNHNFTASLHFDTFKVGQYLKEIALQRSIIHVEDKVEDFCLDAEKGSVTSIQCQNRKIDCDFVIDASGFSRLLIGGKFKTDWISFADTLIMNRALPFHLSHKKEIELVTRATALSSGWVWQIPLQERIGAGYVFNDQFLSDDQAHDEVEKWLGEKIDPIRVIKFEAGYFQKVWVKNVVALDLASGFVEPLEATSIGQMVTQLETLSNFILHNHGVISEQNINYFNKQNGQYWRGIGDFIRMHYDTPREDTPFWKEMKNVPISPEYKELKECWKHRTPRLIDFAEYSLSGTLMFGVPNWFAVGVGTGVIKPESTAAELYALSIDQKRKLAQHLHKMKQKLS